MILAFLIKRRVLNLEPFPLGLRQALVVGHLEHQLAHFGSELILEFFRRRLGVFDRIVQDGRYEGREIGDSASVARRVATSMGWLM